MDTPKIKLGPISFRTSAADMSDWPTWTPSCVPLDDIEKEKNELVKDTNSSSILF